MKRIQVSNPIGDLSHVDFSKLLALEECTNLTFLKAVEILELNAARDFRYTDLSGVDFGDADLSDFDLTGAILTGCKFQGALLEDGGYIQEPSQFLQQLFVSNGPLVKSQSSGEVTAYSLRLQYENESALNDVAQFAIRHGKRLLSSLDNLEFIPSSTPRAEFGSGERLIIAIELSTSKLDHKALEELQSVLEKFREDEKTRIYISSSRRIIR